MGERAFGVARGQGGSDNPLPSSSPPTIRRGFSTANTLQKPDSHGTSSTSRPGYAHTVPVARTSIHSGARSCCEARTSRVREQLIPSRLARVLLP